METSLRYIEKCKAYRTINLIMEDWIGLGIRQILIETTSNGGAPKARWYKKPLDITTSWYQKYIDLHYGTTNPRADV